MPLTLVIAAVLLLVPAPAQAQSPLEFLAALRQGGGWITVPIRAGKGQLRTQAVPTSGVKLAGCIQVWGGHSGRWDIRVRDAMGEGRIEADTRAGRPVPFSYVTGPWGQLTADVRWSEPRDTTLMVWVGLETPAVQRDPCEPVYSGG